MNIFDSIAIIDRDLFFSINQLPHNALFNFIGVLLSAGSGFIWFFVIALFLAFRKTKFAYRTMLSILLAALLTQFFVVVVFKPLIARPRPDMTHESAIIVGSPFESIVPSRFTNLLNNDYAFPSGHATMAAAGAFILSRVLPRKKKYWYTLAIAIALSRLYLGKHYPLDIIGGLLLGLLVGWLSLEMTRQLILAGQELKIVKKA